MSHARQKLNQRVLFLNILNKYRFCEHIDRNELKNDVFLISKFPNQDFIAKMFFCELKNPPTQKFLEAASIIALEAINFNSLEKEALNFLKNDNNSDEVKMIVLMILKQKNPDFDFNDYVNYLNLDEDISSAEINNYIDNAINNLSVQIDIIDFYINLAKDERIFFLNSLKDDSNKDNVACIFSVLISIKLANMDLKDEFELMLDSLLDINSPYCISGLNYVLNYEQIDELKKEKIKRRLKKIHLSNPNCEKDLLNLKSKIYKCYLGYLDGKGDFSMMLSRIYDNGIIDCVFYTINIEYGIDSCIPFLNISKNELIKLTKRVFNDYPQISIEPKPFRALFDFYYEKTLKNNFLMPYEAIVCKKLSDDIEKLKLDISEYINLELEKIPVNHNVIFKILKSEIMQSWFFEKNENPDVDKIVKKIEDEKICELEKIEKIIDECLKDKMNNDINCELAKTFSSKLLIQSYIASLAGYKMSANCLYSICFELKNLEYFISLVFNRSIYYQFILKLDGKNQNNIFKKEAETNFTKDEIMMLLAQFEEKWT